MITEAVEPPERLDENPARQTFVLVFDGSSTIAFAGPLTVFPRGWISKFTTTRPYHSCLGCHRGDTVHPVLPRKVSCTNGHGVHLVDTAPRHCCVLWNEEKLQPCLVDKGKGNSMPSDQQANAFLSQLRGDRRPGAEREMNPPSGRFTALFVSLRR